MTSPRFAVACALAVFLAVTLFDASAGAAGATDPVRHDPSPASRPPAAMEAFGIASSGARLNALFYLAAGPGPHGVAVFLHGYPGNEKNLDLAQAVRRAGYDVLFVDYRGNFGSGGTFSFGHALEDTSAVLAWVRSPENAAKYHYDPRRIALVGHSFGGWLALLSAGRESAASPAIAGSSPPSLCVAALAAWNIGWDGKRFAAHEDERTAALADLRDSTDPSGGPIRADADALLAEMTTHAAEWDYLTQAAALAGRPILLVAASRDTPDEDIPMHAELGSAIRAAGGKSVRNVTFDDDHAFSSHRLALADAVVEWLSGDCARAQR